MSTTALLGGLVLGICIGAASTLVGIGGGVFLIPALVFFYGMSQLQAQGTSIATLLLPIGVLAFWSYYKAGHVDLRLAAVVALGFALGGGLGGMWAQHVPMLFLRRGFAVLLIATAAKLLFTK